MRILCGWQNLGIRRQKRSNTFRVGMEIEEYPYCFHFVWEHRNPNNNFYGDLYDITPKEESVKIFNWIKLNIIDENWQEKALTNDDGLMETYVYFKLSEDAVKFKLIWSAKQI